jgi:hypothetical protein
MTLEREFAPNDRQTSLLLTASRNGCGVAVQIADARRDGAAAMGAPKKLKQKFGAKSKVRGAEEGIEEVTSLRKSSAVKSAAGDGRPTASLRESMASYKASAEVDAPTLT